LEKAREYALMGQTKELMVEITNQGITQEDFLNMNIIQRQAIAKAVGMEVNELADVFQNQKDLSSLQEASLKVQNALKRDGHNTDLQNLNIKTMSLQQLKRYAEQAGMAESELQDLIGDTIWKRKQAESAQETFNKALERAKETFASFVDGGALDSLAHALEIASEKLLYWFGDKETKIQTKYKTIAEEKGIKLSKEDLSSIVNLEMKQEDNISSQTGWEGLKNIFSNFQSFQTKEQKINSILEGNKAEDFIIRPGQPIQKFRKDDVVVGGTNLGGSNSKTEQLLERLVNIVEQGGNVTMDGQKVGQALVFSSYKLQ
jgi:hypothetical protein